MNRPGTDTRSAAGWPFATGIAGSVLVAAASWWLAATPAWFRTHRPVPVSWLPRQSPIAKIAFYLGVGLLTAAWLGYGRRLAEHELLGPLRRAVLAWTLPLLASAPMGRDLWSYAAQGRIVQLGLDPYRASPATIGGDYLAEVSARWQHTPAPYGPLWLEVSRLVTSLSHPHVPAAALLLRLPAWLGVLALAWVLPALARRFGLRADRAVWLAALNPMTVVLGVGGGHNDLAMVSLALAGVVIALSGTASLTRLAVGAAIIGLAVAVKSPAVLFLAFLVPLWRWRTHRSDPRTTVLASLTSATGGLAGFAVITAVSGLGLGWIHQAGSDNTVVNWQSWPTLVGMTANALGDGLHGAATLDSTIRTARTIGLAIAAGLIVIAWAAALRRSDRTWFWLAAAAALLAVSGPAFQPWYLTWALPAIGLAIGPGLGLRLLAAVLVAQVLFTEPSGAGLHSRPIAVPLALLALAVCAAALGSVLAQRDADHARPGVRTDGGADAGDDQLTQPG